MFRQGIHRTICFPLVVQTWLAASSSVVLHHQKANFYTGNIMAG